MTIFLYALIVVFGTMTLSATYFTLKQRGDRRQRAVAAMGRALRRRGRSGRLLEPRTDPVLFKSSTSLRATRGSGRFHAA